MYRGWGGLRCAPERSSNNNHNSFWVIHCRRIGPEWRHQQATGGRTRTLAMSVCAGFCWQHYRLWPCSESIQIGGRSIRKHRNVIDIVAVVRKKRHWLLQRICYVQNFQHGVPPQKINRSRSQYLIGLRKVRIKVPFSTSGMTNLKNSFDRYEIIMILTLQFFHISLEQPIEIDRFWSTPRSIPTHSLRYVRSQCKRTATRLSPAYIRWQTVQIMCYNFDDCQLINYWHTGPKGRGTGCNELRGIAQIIIEFQQLIGGHKSRVIMRRYVMCGAWFESHGAWVGMFAVRIMCAPCVCVFVLV